MDGQLDLVLKKANLEELIPTFKNNDITYDGLRGLTPDLISQITKKIGQRARLELIAADIKAKFVGTVTTDTDILHVAAQKDGPNSQASLLNDKIFVDVGLTSRDRSPVKEQTYGSILKLDLATLLVNNLLGKGLYHKYLEKRILNRKDRAFLVKIVIEDVMKQTTVLKAADFNFIVDSIKKVFSSECSETYFVPCSKRGKHSLGLLPNRYRFIRFLLFKNDIVKSEVGVEEDSEKLAGLVTEEFLQVKNSLKINCDEKDVITDWHKTSNLRVKLLQNSESKNVSEIICDWPALRLPFGYKLICIDFQTLYPECCDNLINSWDSLSNKLVSFMKNNLKDYSSQLLLDTISSSEENIRDLVILKLIPKVCPPAVTTTPNKKKYHPSVADSQESFILHIEDPAKLEEEIAEKEQKEKQLGNKLQPFIIVIGNVSNITSVMIFYDKIYYRVKTVLEAVDCLFKLFQVLNYKYPSACSQIWLFLQQGVYKIYTPYDGYIKLPRVSTLINDLQL